MENHIANWTVGSVAIRGMAGLFALFRFWMIPLSGQTAEGIIARYVEIIGGQDAVHAIKTLAYERVLTHLDDGQIANGVTRQMGA